jgi:hypothetical protein
VPIERIRLRSKAGRELPLGSYQLFQRRAPLEDGVWWKMMRGLTTRNYGAVTKTFRQAYGVEKSAVSERFVQASKEKLHELLERSLADLDLCAMLIDGTPVKGRQMMAVIGIDREGMKHVLGLREGATENATVVRELLEDLARRGVDFTRARSLRARWGQGIAYSGEESGGRQRFDSTLPTAQEAERQGPSAEAASGLRVAADECGLRHAKL